MLDQASAEGSRKDCVWEDVYGATLRFMHKETEKLIADEGKEKQGRRR